LARTLLWTQKASYTYVHIWQVELKFILHKANFSLSFIKTFSFNLISSNIGKTPMYQINSSIGKAPMYLPTLVHPFKFYLRNWDEEIFEQRLVSSLKLSITGDTAKYLDFTLSRGCTPLPTWPGQSFYLDAHFAQRTGADRGRDLLCVITRTIP
jgi:hypothetical protein